MKTVHHLRSETAKQIARIYLYACNNIDIFDDADKVENAIAAARETTDEAWEILGKTITILKKTNQ